MKIFYFKWHYSQSNVNYFMTAAKTQGEADIIFEKWRKDNNVELGAYSPRVLNIPEGGGMMLPFNQ